MKIKILVTFLVSQIVSTVTRWVKTNKQTNKQKTIIQTTHKLSLKGFPRFKHHLSLASISRCSCTKHKSKSFAYSDCISEMCTIRSISLCHRPSNTMCLKAYDYAQLTSLLNILWDPIINHTIGSSAKIKKSLQLWSSGFLVFNHFATKSIQNNQNIAFLVDSPYPHQNLGIPL